MAFSLIPKEEKFFEMFETQAGHNVEAAKVKARELMKVYQQEGRLPKPKPLVVDGDIEVYGQSVVPLGNLTDALGAFLKGVEQGDYLALMAYVPFAPAYHAQLHRLRMTLRDRLRVATTSGYGPRFLHSTGQLHKGDGNKGVFLQITHEPSYDLPIPGEPYSFGTLAAAQRLVELVAHDLSPELQLVATLHPRKGV